jgi:hypothetical protein
MGRLSESLKRLYRAMFVSSPSVDAGFILESNGEKWLYAKRYLKIVYNNPKRWYAVCRYGYGVVPPRILVPINKSGKVGAGKAFWSSGTKSFKSELMARAGWPQYVWAAHEPLRRADLSDLDKYKAVEAPPEMGVFRIEHSQLPTCVARCEMIDYLAIISKQAVLRLGQAQFDRILEQARRR